MCLLTSKFILFAIYLFASGTIFFSIRAILFVNNIKLLNDLQAMVDNVKGYFCLLAHIHLLYCRVSTHYTHIHTSRHQNMEQKEKRCKQ